MTKDKRNQIALLVRGTCFTVLILFVSVFLVAQIFTISGESFTAVALFFLVTACANLFAYTMAVLLCKRIKAIRVSQFACVLACGFICMIIFWQSGLENFYLLFGAIWGTAQGMHFATGQYLTSRSFSAEKTVGYFVWHFGLAALVSVLFPFTFGLIIDLGSLTITAILVLVIGAIQLTATFFVKCENAENKNLRMRKFFREVKRHNFRQASWSLWVIVLLSGFVNVIQVTVTVMVILTFGTNISLGALKSIFGLCAVIFLICYKLGKRPVKTTILIMCMIVPFFATLPLLFHIGLVTVAIFQGGFLIFNKVIMAEEKALKVSAVKYWGGEEYLLESNLFYATGHWCGKVVAGSMLLLIGILGATPLVVAIILNVMVLMFCIYALGLFLWKRTFKINSGSGDLSPGTHEDSLVSHPEPVDAQNPQTLSP